MCMGQAEIQEAAQKYLEQQKENEQSSKQKQLNAQKLQIEALEKQLAGLKSKFDGLNADFDEIRNTSQTENEKLRAAKEHIAELERKLAEMKKLEEETDPAIIANLRRLIELNETLKDQEKKFKQSCQKEMEEWEERVRDAEGKAEGKNDEYTLSLRKVYEEEKAKSHKIKSLLAQKNRDIAKIQREMDEVPTRQELGQYQTRFIELFSLIGMYHAENKKHINTFNALVDVKNCLDREGETVTKLIESFPNLIKNKDSQQKLIKNMDQIVEATDRSSKKQIDRLTVDQGRLAQLQTRYNEMLEERKQYLKMTRLYEDAMEANMVLEQKLQEKQEEIEREKELKKEMRQAKEKMVEKEKIVQKKEEKVSAAAAKKDEEEEEVEEEEEIVEEVEEEREEEVVEEEVVEEEEVEEEVVEEEVVEEEVVEEVEEES